MRNHSRALWGIAESFVESFGFLSNLYDTKNLDYAQLKQAKTFKIMKAQRLAFFLLAVEGQTSKTGVSTTCLTLI